MTGVDVLNDFLKSEAGLPEGDPQEFPTGEGSAEVQRPADGGKVAGVGKTGGEGNTSAVKGAEVGAPSVPEEKLSPDDENVSSQLDEGMPRELGKSQSRITRHEQEHTVALANARARAHLRKSDDVTVGVGVRDTREPAPVEKSVDPTAWNQGEDSVFQYDDALDLRAEALLKSDGLYAGQPPALDVRRSRATTTTLCKSCESPMSGMLTACPHCGAGCTGHALAKSGMAVMTVDEGVRPGPTLRKSVEEADLIIKG